MWGKMWSEILRNKKMTHYQWLDYTFGKHPHLNPESLFKKYEAF